MNPKSINWNDRSEHPGLEPGYFCTRQVRGHYTTRPLLFFNFLQCAPSQISTSVVHSPLPHKNLSRRANMCQKARFSAFHSVFISLQSLSPNKPLLREVGEQGTHHAFFFKTLTTTNIDIHPIHPLFHTGAQTHTEEMPLTPSTKAETYFSERIYAFEHSFRFQFHPQMPIKWFARNLSKTIDRTKWLDERG